MDKRFKPQEIEEKWYRFWEDHGLFKPQINPSKEPFVITLPPPNVTGGLHAGHALFTVEDIIARYHRMCGEPTLFLPGFDHASISVEYLVSKQLAREGKTKKEVGREEFLKQAQKFANDSRSYIREQLKKLGYSLDWSREAYTMDKTRAAAVKEAFERLYKKGLIYRGERIINWCVGCQTVLSDLEVEHEEEKSKLWFLKYPVKDSDETVVVATTRPETMLGDTAVAVHPDDKRYKVLIGQVVLLPLANREISIIADEVVDPEFGTGAVKVTPAHDLTDFEIGRRHNLETVSVIGFDGRMAREAGRHYRGETAAVARGRILEDLRKLDLLQKEADHTHAVGRCQRCGTIVEPLISKQWFVKAEPLAEKAIAAVKSGQIKIIPKRFEKVYFHWLEDIRDWCISRQLWWGHKIPIEGEEDILDTWFSSGLWPISVFGWPQKTSDLEYFYPTTVRETAYDILFFWVAREIMLCLELTGEVPFKAVYLHGLVRDEKGRKFSKTKGIGFDPLDVTGKYGTDALRMALIVGNPPGADLKIGEDRFVAYRNFTNKLWNIARFVLLDQEKKDLDEPSKQDAALKSLLKTTIEEVNKNFEDYRFDLAAEKLYHVVWDDFASRYLEDYKKGLVSYSVLIDSFLTLLKLLHPFMPFITEDLYQRLPNKDAKSIMIASWPRPLDL